MKDKKRLRYGMYSIVTSLVVVLVIIGINLLVTLLGQKVQLKFDMTQNQLYDITAETKDYLASYDTPVTIYVLSSEANEDKKVSMILDQYAILNSNIKVENINPTENPTFGRKYVSDGENLISDSVIVDGGERFRVYEYEELYSSDRASIDVENKITSALKYVSGENNTSVYFITGHNEKRLDGVEEELESQSYGYANLNLMTEDIPPEAAAVIISAPSADFTSAELVKLDNYLASGGGAMFFLNADSSGLTELYSYLEEWGVVVNNTIVVEGEQSKYYQVQNQQIYFCTPDIESTPITDALIEHDRLIGYIPYSRTFEVKDVNDTEVTTLLTSTDNAYTTSDFDNQTQGADSVTGEAIIGLTAENVSSGGRIYVCGNMFLYNNSPELIDDTFGFANFDYFMNLLSYCEGEDDYTASARTIFGSALVVSKTATDWIFRICVVAIPLATLIIGVAVWMRRKHL